MMIEIIQEDDKYFIEISNEKQTYILISGYGQAWQDYIDSYKVGDDDDRGTFTR